MDDQRYREFLEQVHSEIESTTDVDEKGEEYLRDLKADIQILLDRTESDRLQPHPSMFRRLEDSIDWFEVTHPKLTTVLSQLLTTLSNAGI